jgi:hypothetical protein
MRQYGTDYSVFQANWPGRILSLHFGDPGKSIKKPSPFTPATAQLVMANRP